MVPPAKDDTIVSDREHSPKRQIVENAGNRQINKTKGIKMRELKFRAWDEGNEVMHNDVEFIRSGTENNDWILFKSDKQTLEDDEVLSNPYLQQQLKIMQYTGMNDSEGTEIYEGDVVRLINGKEEGIIKYGTAMVTSDDNCCSGSGLGYYIDIDEYSKEMLGSTEHGWGSNPTTSKNMLVIGNIYENKT